jgi:phosphopantothenoylcysteine decarboxylase
MARNIFSLQQAVSSFRSSSYPFTNTLNTIGSVAVIKLPLLISSFAQYSNLSIRVILTRNAMRFLAGQSTEQPTLASLALLPNVDSIHQDEDEWSQPWVRDSKILHIELRRWGHILVVAPMSANLLAKIANGLCDSLLTTVIRAWDPTSGKRILVAPSMNTCMWTHPLTGRQLSILKDTWGVDGTNISSGWYEILMPQR